jgi:hypothetical protein
MAKKLKKYQDVGQVNSGPGGISDADMKEVLKRLKEKDSLERSQNPVKPLPVREYPGKPKSRSEIIKPLPVIIKPGEKPKSRNEIVTPMKKGGPVTALNKVQEMYSKKKK